MDAAGRSNSSNRQPRIRFCFDCQRLTAHVAVATGAPACGYCGATGNLEAGGRPRSRAAEAGLGSLEHLPDSLLDQDY